MDSPDRTPTVLQAPVSRNVQLLLESRVPARMAWIDRSGRPLVAPLWFVWNGRQLVLATFAGSRKLDDLTDGDVVAVTIDTEAFPYRSLRLRGPITIEHLDGLGDEYRQAATRYLGRTAGQDWCDRLSGVAQVRILVHPTEASASDMSDAGYLTDPPTLGD